MKISIFRSIMFVILCFNYSCVEFDCTDYAEKTLRPKKYSFIVTNKSQDGRYISIEGIGLKGKKETFKEVGFNDIYDNVNVGDSLKKDSGQVQVKIINKKNSNSKTYYYYCHGKFVK